MILLGFAIYETIYIDELSDGSLSASYFKAVLPIVVGTIYSLWSSSRFITKGMSPKGSFAINRKLLLRLAFTIYVEVLVIYLSASTINERTAFLFVIGFLVGKMAMYSEYFATNAGKEKA